MSGLLRSALVLALLVIAAFATSPATAQTAPRRIGLYPDGTVEHDKLIGDMLKKLDDLGIANDTIVVYSTDNGAETFTWPDGGTTQVHGEKGTTWEGGFRVSQAVRWPSVIKSQSHRRPGPR